MFRASFKEIFKGGLKHINSLSKKVCFVVVVCQSSQLPEQKEGLFRIDKILKENHNKLGCARVKLLVELDG